MFPEDIIQWFASRGITEKSIKNFGLWWDGHRIVIPIKDEKGKTIFNKYRRDPRKEEGPKYTYDKGASVKLFNYKDTYNKIVNVEGELDAVRLFELGYDAVSSTGGAVSFQEEWVKLLKDKEVFICYDNDDAGFRGALKTALLLPSVRIISFPAYWQGKDVTDFLQHHTKEEFDKLIKSAYELPIPKDNKKNSISQALAKCVDLRRTLNGKKISTNILEHFVHYLNQQKQKNTYSTKKIDYIKNIKTVKDIPITDFLDFNIANFRSCIFPGHRDKTPSLKYFEDTNTCYCFGCHKYGDVITVVRLLQNTTFTETIKYLKEKYGKQ